MPFSFVQTPFCFENHDLMGALDALDCVGVDVPDCVGDDKMILRILPAAADVVHGLIDGDAGVEVLHAVLVDPS